MGENFKYFGALRVNVFLAIIYHNFLYSLLLCVVVLLCYWAGALGITAGAHRLWSHRAYKARLPLRILLAIFNSLAFQV